MDLDQHGESMGVRLDTEKVCGSCLEPLKVVGEGQFECGSCQAKFKD